MALFLVWLVRALEFSLYSDLWREINTNFKYTLVLFCDFRSNIEGFELQLLWLVQVSKLDVHVNSMITPNFYI